MNIAEFATIDRLRGQNAALAIDRDNCLHAISSLKSEIHQQAATIAELKDNIQQHLDHMDGMRALNKRMASALTAIEKYAADSARPQLVNLKFIHQVVRAALAASAVQSGTKVTP